MIRIIYVAGKYRVYRPDKTFDLEAMAANVRDEQLWCRRIAEWGHMWFGPLCNSVHLEDNCPIPADEFVQRDLSIIQRMRPGWDCILMRPGWDDEPFSRGAAAELEEATDQGLLVLTGAHGADAVREYLESLNGEQE